MSIHTVNYSRLKEQLEAQRLGQTLDQDFYTSESIFQAEMTEIWHKEWLFAGLTCEVPDAGDWFKLEVGKASVIIMRGRDHQIRAFHNTCRHRGSRICLENRGSSRNLVCPYHQWTYDDTGALLFARQMTEEFDKTSHSLKTVHVKELAGYLFINLAENPSCFDDFIHIAEPYLIDHGLKEAKVAFEMTLIEEANWKLVLENNRECYHCKSGHPELLKTIAEVEDINDPNCPPEYIDKAKGDVQRWEKQGLLHQLIKSDEGWQIVRVPMYRGVSFTLDGTPASNMKMGNLPDFDVGSVRLLHFPNTWNHALGDHAIAFRVLPLGPNKTAVTTKWLVHAEAEEEIDYDLERLIYVWRATNEQDKRLAENNQLGISSPAYQRGTYSVEAEYGVIAFLNWYLETMKKRVDESLDRQPELGGGCE